MNSEVIEAMCKAYWNARGGFPWEDEGPSSREQIRVRMRAALAARDKLVRSKEDAMLSALGTEDLL